MAALSVCVSVCCLDFVCFFIYFMSSNFLAELYYNLLAYKDKDLLYDKDFLCLKQTYKYTFILIHADT